MNDGFGRKIDYLRISVTEACNLTCVYCKPNGAFRAKSQKPRLSFAEIKRIADAASLLGITKLKLTGGEPLLRDNLPELVSLLRQNQKFQSVTLTTNGLLLKAHAEELVKAGLDGINISLDSVNPDTFHRMTGGAEVQEALDGIAVCRHAGIKQIRLNVLPLQGYNDGELLDLVAFADKTGCDIRFIELMPLGLGERFSGVASDEIMRRLEQKYGPLVPSDFRGNGPAEYFTAPALSIKVGFIRAVSHNFCNQCNRLRLTSAGLLKTCLYYSPDVDLKALLDTGADDMALYEAIRQAVLEKPLMHGFSCGETADGGKSAHRFFMNEVGG